MSEYRVKPLEWRQDDPHFPHEADTIVGKYAAWDFGGKDGHYMRPGDFAGVRVDGDLEAAKGAAQAHFDSLIRSAILPTPTEGE